MVVARMYTLKLKDIIVFSVILMGIIGCARNRNRIKSQETQEVLPPDTVMTAVEVDSSQEGLTIYYPHVGGISLVTKEMPDTSSINVIFCCAAAFTGELSNEFRHSNIAGDHVSDGMGKRYRGYRCLRNTGAFVYYNEKWKFLYEDYSAELDSAAKYNGMGFGQEMMIHQGRIVPHTRKDSDEDLFRALCEINGRIGIADAKECGTFGDFINSLLRAGVSEALYLDMGAGWNHSWYKPQIDDNLMGKAIVIQPKEHSYCTNWLTFYYMN